MKLTERTDQSGRKILRAKQTKEELRAELARLQAEHERFLRLNQSVTSLSK